MDLASVCLFVTNGLFTPGCNKQTDGHTDREFFAIVYSEDVSKNGFETNLDHTFRSRIGALVLIRVWTIIRTVCKMWSTNLDAGMVNSEY